MFIAFLIFFYLNYPGVQKQFVEHEMSLLTPEQRAAMEQVQAANAAAARAMATPAAPAAPAAPARPRRRLRRRQRRRRAPGDPRRNPSHPTIGRVTGSDPETDPRPAGRSRHVTGGDATGSGSLDGYAGRGSKRGVTGRPSSAGEPGDARLRSGTRSAGAWRRRRCAGRRARSPRRSVSSPSRTAHASR